MKAGIVGMAAWVPERVRTNDAWSKSFVRAASERREARRRQDFSVIDSHREARRYDELYRRFAASYAEDPFKGTIERRVAPDGQPAVVGDAAALSRALEDAGVDPAEVDVVMSAALVPDRVVPSNGPETALLAGCANAAAFAVDSVCSSVLSQLDLATALVETGRARWVACVQSHQISRANDLSTPSSPLFGDASTAFVVGAVPADRGLVRVVRGGDGSVAGAVTWVFGGDPASKWWEGARGPATTGSQDYEAAHRIGNNLLGYAVDTIRELCAATGFDAREAAALCMIQPVAWYHEAVAEALRLSIDRVPSTHASYAHVGAAGVTLNLIEARRRGLLSDGAPVILYAHGAGLTRYAALIRWRER